MKRITILQLLSGVFSLALLFSCSKKQKPESKPKPEEKIEADRYYDYKYFYTSIIDPQEIIVEYVQPRYDYDKVAKEFTEDVALLTIRVNTKKGVFYSYDSKDAKNKAIFYKYADSWGDGNWNATRLWFYEQKTLLEPISSIDVIALTDFDEQHKAGSSLNDLIEFRFASSEKYFQEYVVKNKRNTDMPELETICKPIGEIKDLKFLSTINVADGQQQTPFVYYSDPGIAYLALKKPATLRGKKLKVSIHFPTKTLEAEAILGE